VAVVKLSIWMIAMKINDMIANTDSVIADDMRMTAKTTTTTENKLPQLFQLILSCNLYSILATIVYADGCVAHDTVVHRVQWLLPFK